MLEVNLPPPLDRYQLIVGKEIDVATVLKFLQLTYAEIFPHQPNFHHLQSTVDRHFSSSTPLWFVTIRDGDRDRKIACLWMGIAIDQINGIRHPNIFLMYVDPVHRRQGIAKLLMTHAHTWAKEHGYTQIGLQVFSNNQPAIDLYQQLGYQARSISMIAEL